MRIPRENIFGVVLTLALLLASSPVPAQEQSQGQKAPAVKPESLPAIPSLSKFIPLAAQLSGRLTALENRIGEGPDLSAIERKCVEIESDLTGVAGQLQQLRDSRDYKYGKSFELRAAIQKEENSLEKINEPLSEAIDQLNTWRKEWLTEKERWNAWRSSLLKEGVPDQLKSTFATASDTIDKSLSLVLLQLGTMLTAQQQVGNVQAKVYAVSAELDRLISVRRHSVLLQKSPPMFSYRYLSQFGNELWYAIQQGLGKIAWPERRFFTQQGWIVLLQGFLSVFVIIALYRNRPLLHESTHWRFLSVRPFSSGLFLGFMTTLLFYEYVGIPAVWKLVNAFVCGISYARLSGALLGATWKKHFVYGLTIVLIVMGLMYVGNFPLPVVRLFIFLTALVGLFFFLRWSRESRREEDSIFYTWSLRLGALSFGFIIIAELWGKNGPAEFFFIASIRSITLMLVSMLFLYVIHGGLEWLFRISPLRQVAVIYSDPKTMIRRTAGLFNVAMGLVLLPGLLMAWGAYDNFREAVDGVLTFGFNLGSQRISVDLLLLSAGILYVALLTSWILQKLLIDEVLVRRRMEFGIRLSIARLVHYVVVLLGFLVAISALGFEITKITIMLSALGVGIGFGLQGVVNNFVSGLILLFERPVRQGDYVEFDGTWAEIKRIGLRATTVQTFDNADVIIPNADLVTHKVTNWTLSNRRMRIIVPVGVAYGSDVSLVMETLMAGAAANAKVAKTPPPQVLFLRFGESSLDFELRVWVLDVNDMLNVKSELHQEIDRDFREKKIEIAFPQRDVHVHSLAESVVSPSPETGG